MKDCLLRYAWASLPNRFQRQLPFQKSAQPPFEFPITNDYSIEGISPAGASGTVTGLYRYRPRSSAVAPGFGPLFVTP